LKEINQEVTKIGSYSDSIDIIASQNEVLGGLLAEVLDGAQDRSVDGVSESIDRVASGIGELNMIPGSPGSCHELCICKAFDKWGAKSGFRGVSEQTITLWLACAETNRNTIVFTTAWDEIDFNQRYRNQFDAQTSDPHKTVCVVLVTSQGIAIPYFE
jgi:hypothetical protein